MAVNITRFDCGRCRQDGTIDESGTYLKVSLTYTSTVPSNYQIRYTKDSISNLVTFKNGRSVSVNTSFVSDTAILEADYSYMFFLVVQEDTIIKSKIDFVPQAFVLMDFNASGKGVSFGKASEKAEAMEIAMPVFDRFGTQMLNGLSYYEAGGSADPNTTVEELILTSTNTPVEGAFFYVKTMFYADKSETANRTQYAYPYSAAMSTFYRYYNNGTWSAWIEQPVIIEQGTTGIWTWNKYSNGTAECFGKINLAQVPVTAALGGWYRSEVLFEATEYPYPVSFSSAPATEMMFQTRNGNGALLWSFSSSAENVKLYLPQCYIIRPTTASSVNGNINVIAKGLL